MRAGFGGIVGTSGVFTVDRWSRGIAGRAGCLGGHGSEDRRFRWHGRELKRFCRYGRVDRRFRGHSNQHRRSQWHSNKDKRSRKTLQGEQEVLESTVVRTAGF